MLYAMTVFLMLIKSSVVMSASDAGLWVEAPEPHNKHVKELRGKFLSLCAQSTHYREVDFCPKNLMASDVESLDEFRRLRKCFEVWDSQEIKNDLPKAQYEKCVSALLHAAKGKSTERRLIKKDELEDEFQWTERIGNELAGNLETICSAIRRKKAQDHFGIAFGPAHIGTYTKYNGNVYVTKDTKGNAFEWRIQATYGKSKTVRDRLFYFGKMYGGEALKMLNLHLKEQAELRARRYIDFTYNYIINGLETKYGQAMKNWTANQLKEISNTCLRNGYVAKTPQDFEDQFKQTLDRIRVSGVSASKFVGSALMYIEGEQSHSFGYALNFVERAQGMLSLKKRAEFLSELIESRWTPVKPSRFAQKSSCFAQMAPTKPSCSAKRLQKAAVKTQLQNLIAMGTITKEELMAMFD